MALTARVAAQAALDTRVSPEAAIRGPIAAGILTSLSNPYWFIWWATIGLNFASLALRQGALGLASFYTGHILSDLAWYSLVAAAVSSGRRICPRGVYVALLVGCGLALVGLGGRFFFGALGGLSTLR